MFHIASRTLTRNDAGLTDETPIMGMFKGFEVGIFGCLDRGDSLKVTNGGDGLTYIVPRCRVFVSRENINGLRRGFTP